MEKIIKYSNNELQEQIIRFFFSSYCFGFAGSIELINNGINIKYRHNDSYDEDENNNTEYEFTLDNWNEFVNELFKINIYNWHEEYENKDFPEDCEEWTIEIDFKNMEKIKKYGYDDYPYNWEKFQNLIRKYFPQMEY